MIIITPYLFLLVLRYFKQNNNININKLNKPKNIQKFKNINKFDGMDERFLKEDINDVIYKIRENDNIVKTLNLLQNDKTTFHTKLSIAKQYLEMTEIEVKTDNLLGGNLMRDF
jgi:hypothetical protein